MRRFVGPAEVVHGLPLREGRCLGAGSILPPMQRFTGSLLMWHRDVNICGSPWRPSMPSFPHGWYLDDPCSEKLAGRPHVDPRGRVEARSFRERESQSDRGVSR
jgi:hypothetical protein